MIVGGWDDIAVKIDNHLIPLYRSLKSHGTNDVSILALQDDHLFANTREDLAVWLIQWIDHIDGQTPYERLRAKTTESPPM